MTGDYISLCLKIRVTATRTKKRRQHFNYMLVQHTDVAHRRRTPIITCNLSKRAYIITSKCQYLRTEAEHSGLSRTRRTRQAKKNVCSRHQHS